MDMIDSECFNFYSVVFLRTPFYSFRGYRLKRAAELLGQVEFRNALWLASPEFYRVLERKGFELGSFNDRERLTLYKYANRMSFRPTPFGAFAAYSLPGWGEGGKITLVPEKEAVVQLLPSLAWKEAFRKTGNPGNGELFCVANPTLCLVGEEWRYTYSTVEPSGRLDFSVNVLAAGPVNDFLIALAGEPVCYSVAVAALSGFSGCSEAEAADYAAYLLEGQIWIPADQVRLMEEDEVMPVRRHGSVAAFWSSLKSLRIAGIPAMPELAGRAAAFTLPDEPIVQPFYAAMERPVLKGGTDHRHQQRLLAALSVLSRIVAPARLEHLQDFKQAFKERFDRQVVPLLTVLDPDAGIGYGNLHRQATVYGLLEGIRFPDLRKPGGTIEWTVARRLLLRVWLQNSGRDKLDTVVIADEDLIDLEGDSRLQMPPGLAVLYRESGDRLLLESAGGVTATALIGRFSAFSAHVSAFCREIAAAESEANPDVVFAEVHQLSHRHVDNINRRRPVYDYVIPLNVFSTPGLQEVISPADLLVSVRGDQVVLFSGRLGKRVIPRIPTAYNYHHNELALFRFLGDLQFQGLQADLTFNPERLFPGMGFYPRFEYRDTILSLARWHLKKEELAPLLARPFSIGLLHVFREERGIPLVISLGWGDQQLVFNLVNDDEALFFLECLRESKTVVVQEYLYSGEAVTSGGNAYVAQAIALLKNKREVYRGLPDNFPLAADDDARDFYPGSEWLYLKIYCTPQSADALLTGVIYPFVSGNYGLIKCWFFIRYEDPGTHLRVRFRVEEADAGRLLLGFKEALRGSGFAPLVREYKQETYKRELERYTPELVEAVERFFCSGSDCVLLLKLSELQMNRTQAQLEPFLMVYLMTGVFIPDCTARLEFFKRMKQGFLLEIKADEKMIRDFDLKYRGLSGGLRLTLGTKKHPEVLEVATAAMYKDLEWLSLATVKWPVMERDTLIADLIHMQVNRIFAEKQRAYEGFIYYVLEKYSCSMAARRNQARKD